MSTEDSEKNRSLTLCEHSRKGSFTQAIFVAQCNDAFFVALKLQLQNRACKPAAISARF